MLFLFRDRTIKSLLALIFITCAVHTHFFVGAIHPIEKVSVTGYLSILINDYLQNINYVIGVVLYLLIVIIQALSFDEILSRNKVFSRSDFRAGLVYVLLSSFFIEWHRITPALISNFFTLSILANITRLSDTTSRNHNIRFLFNTGFVAGLALLCYTPMVIIITAMPILIYIFNKKIRVNEWLGCIIGIAVPYYFIWGIGYLFAHGGLDNYLQPQFVFHIPTYNFQQRLKSEEYFLIKLVIVVVFFIIGSFMRSLRLKNVNATARKIGYQMAILFIAAVAILFCFRQDSIEIFCMLMIIPITAYMTNLIAHPRLWLLSNLFMVCAIAIIVYNNWVWAGF